MNIITVEIDLAKNVFAVHGIDDNDKPELGKQLAGKILQELRGAGATSQYDPSISRLIGYYQALLVRQFH